MARFDIQSFALGTAVALLAALGAPASVFAAGSIPISQVPLFSTTGVAPLMLIVMSRDEQLYMKAYSDYTDLDGDGQIDATYNNAFAYSGYFDSDLCYGYNSGVFKAAAAASNHQCSGLWSGNFLNWVTMSRLDMLRYVLYGGKRSTDTASSTVLERAAIPNDLHAWAKVYSGSDINLYTPLTGTQSFCNATMPGSTSPMLRVAAGAYTEWAATESSQCNVNNGNPADPSASQNYTVRVDVCDESAPLPREAFCRAYTNSSTGVVTWKPAGLLQEYGENGSLRFGLFSGSYGDPRSGGRLRRNIGQFAGNGSDPTTCVAGDEIKLSDGTFCNQTAGTEGMINTLNRLMLVGWDGTYPGWTGGITGAPYNDNCYAWGGRARNGNYGAWVLDNPGGGDRHCSAWGNPLSELYAEAVRYIVGDGNAPTSSFVAHSDTNFIPGIPDMIPWIDPYGAAVTDSTGGIGGGNAYCATCSILVLSTGLNSFDSDEIPSTPVIGSPATATTAVGTNEGISGNYLIGRVLGQGGSPASLALNASINTASDMCTSKSLSDLAKAIGICPDVPSLEGSYLMDGMAYKAWTTDLRPNLTDALGNPKPADAWNQVQTYAVALAESLPKFQIPVGSNTITFSPICQSNTNGNIAANGVGWSSCALGSVYVGAKAATYTPGYIYGRPLRSDNLAGTYQFTWEDSTFGSDHDLDITNVITWCVGSQCTYKNGQAKKNIDGSNYTGYDICWRSTDNVCTSASGKPSVGANQILMRVETTSTAGGYSGLTGFNISGTTADGVKTPALLTNCSGMGFFSILAAQTNPPACWATPSVIKFTAGTSSTKRLQNPLWYAAKYGGFTKADANGKRNPPRAGDMPGSGDWEATDGSGDPANYFLVHDPSKLKTQLQAVFNAVLESAAQAGSIMASSALLRVGTLGYQATYNSDGWVGDIAAYHLNPDGSAGTQAWGGTGAAAKLPAGARSDIWVGVPNGGSPATYSAKALTSSNLPSAMQTALTSGGGWLSSDLNNLIAWIEGDQTNEQPSGSFRKRDVNGRLGDIVDSSPQVMYPGWDSGFDRLNNPPGCDSTCTGSYRAFVNGRTAATVFVGSNDGMLHAFDASDTSSGGQELFAYMPYAVVDKIGQTAQPAYAHTFSVDGTPALGDAYLGGGWKTVLVGSAGAGAASVFALDVTNPSSFGTGSLLFEFTADDDPDLGQFTGIPSPPRLTADGKWVTAFGNGYNGASNKAKLFVVNLADGTTVQTDPITDAANAAPNGLSTATVADVNGLCSDGTNVCPDGVGDTIYAGDYHGNVWRWQLSSGRWVLNPTTPIFKATDSYDHQQPITSGMFVQGHPLGGVLVYFGTGKYLDSDDTNPNYLQPDGNRLVNSIYAIWDDGSGSTVLKSELQQQTVDSYSQSSGEWLMSQNAFDYKSTQFPDGKMGWYVDLTAPGTPDPLRGERVVASPVTATGKLLVNAFRPNGVVCEPGGINSLLELSLLTGAAAYPGSGGGGSGGGMGGHDTVQGPPLGSPNPIVSIPGQPGIPAIGCPDGTTTCQPPTGDWCTTGVPGYPVCPDPVWCQAGMPGYPNCTAPLWCHPAGQPNPGDPATPGFPYCQQSAQECMLIPNVGVSGGAQSFQCRAAWRQIR